MDKQTKQYFRNLINDLDNKCNLVNEIIQDNYLQDDENIEFLFEAIEILQNEITNYQEINNYI